MYTIDGTEIKSLVDIPADCYLLIACEDEFVNLEMNQLFDTSETYEQFTNRLIIRSNILVDSIDPPVLASCS